MLRPGLSSPRFFQAGFTLIEVIVGIVVLAIALTLITAVLGPLSQKSTEPWHQVRAAELGHSFLNEVMARSFDENSDRSGGAYRCDATTEAPTAISCTNVSNGPCDSFGPDPIGACPGSSAVEARNDFDDVDDFHNFSATGDAITNILGLNLTGLYNGYQVQVNVVYDGDFDNNPNEIGAAERLAKRITVTVTTPGGQQFRFAAYRSNW